MSRNAPSFAGENFISHLVQIKLVECVRREEGLVLYIPLSSDKTTELNKIEERRKKLYIPLSSDKTEAIHKMRCNPVRYLYIPLSSDKTLMLIIFTKNMMFTLYPT